MILQALYELSEREKLMSDPDFQWKSVAWIVKVGKNGQFIGITPTHYTLPPKGRTKPKPRAKDFRVPYQQGRSGIKAPAYFFVDNAKYVFGKATKDKDFSEEEGKVKSREFQEYICNCAIETNDNGAIAVMSYLQNVAAGVQDIELPDGCLSNDQFAFVYAPDGDILVHERPAIQKYWRKQRSLDSQGDYFYQCLVTGKLISEIGLVPQLKKVPGKGTGSGIALVSFNKPAFESYGLTGNENAPLSRFAAESCTTALNRLLDDAFPNPNLAGEKMPQRNYKISGDTVVCFWAIRDESQDFCNQFAPILEANPDCVRETYYSIWKGRMPDDVDSGAFYAMTLSGAKGRAIVRDWFESTVRDAVAHISAYFADLNIVRNTPKPKERELPPQLPLTILLRSIAAQGKTEDIPPHIASQMIRAALSGKRYPLTVFQRALERMRAEIGNDDWLDMERRDARAALIKAVLIRNYNLEVKREMDPTNKNEGYTLGCLMAVLERIQQEAIDNINANVIDRYFSGASAAPKSVFVRLMKNARNHVRKAKDNPSKAGVVFLMDRLLDELSERFNPEKGGFPSHLSLEDQGLFVIGYHQMRHWLWMPQEQRKEWESQYSCLPKAFAWSKS